MSEYCLAHKWAIFQPYQGENKLCSMKLYSNAIGYVTSNFISQLHLRVRVNFTLYLVGNISTIFQLYHDGQFIGGGNLYTRRKPPTCRISLTNFIKYCCIVYTSPWVGFELTTLVVIGTDCIWSCKPSYHKPKRHISYLKS